MLDGSPFGLESKEVEIIITPNVGLREYVG